MDTAVFSDLPYLQGGAVGCINQQSGEVPAKTTPGVDIDVSGGTFYVIDQGVSPHHRLTQPIFPALWVFPHR